MKASAVAHPIQGLVKYHGLRDFELRIPYHDSISVCMGPTRTCTTVAFGDSAKDEVTIDGQAVEGRALARAVRIVDAMRALAKTEEPVRVVSESNFPKYVGLGSSSSGFAALAVACNEALGLELEAEAVSAVARLGAGSATRSVMGGFSEWVTRGEKSVGRALAGPGDLDWATIGVVVSHDVPTEGVHRDVMASPYYPARLEEVEGRLKEVREAIRSKQSEPVMAIAESDTLSLHAVTMTSPRALVTWRGITVEVLHAVRSLRERGGVPAYISIDTGATVYVNTLQAHAATVRKTLQEVVGSQARLEAFEVAPAAHVSGNHLF